MSSLNSSLQPDVERIFARIRPFFGLGDTWQIQLVNGKCLEEDGVTPYRGGCESDPEYSEATIKIDMEQLRTGDQIEEIVAHETTHIHLMWLHNEAHHLAGLAGHLLPDQFVDPTTEYLREKVRVAAEKSTTDLGHSFLRCFRRI